MPSNTSKNQNLDINKRGLYKLVDPKKENLIGNDKNVIIDYSDQNDTHKELNEEKKNICFESVFSSDEEKDVVPGLNKIMTGKGSPNQITSTCVSEFGHEDFEHTIKGGVCVQPNCVELTACQKYGSETKIGGDSVENMKIEESVKSGLQGKGRVKDHLLVSFLSVQEEETNNPDYNRNQMGRCFKGEKDDVLSVKPIIESGKNKSGNESKSKTFGSSLECYTSSVNNLITNGESEILSKTYSLNTECFDNSVSSLCVQNVVDTKKNKFNNSINSSKSTNSGHEAQKCKLAINNTDSCKRTYINDISSNDMSFEREIEEIFDDETDVTVDTGKVPVSPQNNSSFPKRTSDPNCGLNEILPDKSVRPYLTNNIQKEDRMSNSQKTMQEDGNKTNTLPDIELLTSQGIRPQTAENDDLPNTSQREINKEMEHSDAKNIDEIFLIEDKSNEDDFDRIFDEEFDAVMNEEAAKQTKKGSKQGTAEETKHIKNNEITEFIKQKNINNRINTANTFLGVTDRFARYETENMEGHRLESAKTEVNITKDEKGKSTITYPQMVSNLENNRRNPTIVQNEIVSENQKQSRVVHDYKKMQNYVTHPNQRSHIYYVQNIDNAHKNRTMSTPQTNFNTNEQLSRSGGFMQKTKHKAQSYELERKGYDSYTKHHHSPPYMSREQSKEIRDKVANVQMYGNSIGYSGKFVDGKQNHLQENIFLRKNRYEEGQFLPPRINTNALRSHGNHPYKSSYTHMARKGDVESIHNRLSYLNQASNRNQLNMQQNRTIEPGLNSSNKRYKPAQEIQINQQIYNEHRARHLSMEAIARRSMQTFVHKPGFSARNIRKPTGYPELHPNQYKNSQFANRNNFNSPNNSQNMSQNTNNNKNTNMQNQSSTNKETRSKNIGNIPEGYPNSSVYIQQRNSSHVDHVNGYNAAQRNKLPSNKTMDGITRGRNVSISNDNQTYRNVTHPKFSGYPDINPYYNHPTYSGNQTQLRNSREEMSQGVEHLDNSSGKKLSMSYHQSNTVQPIQDVNRKTPNTSDINTYNRTKTPNFIDRFDNLYSNFNNNLINDQRHQMVDYPISNIDKCDNQPQKNVPTCNIVKNKSPKNSVKQERSFDTQKDINIMQRITTNSLFPFNSSFYTSKKHDKEHEDCIQKIKNLNYCPLELDTEQIIFVKAKINNSKSLFKKLNYLMSIEPVDEKITNIYNTLSLQKEAFEKEIYFLKVKDIDSMIEEINKEEEKKKKENPNLKPIEYSFNENGCIWATKKIAKNFEDQKKRNKDFELQLGEKKEFEDEIEPAFDFNAEFDDL